jgi:hypothetical protein
MICRSRLNGFVSGFTTVASFGAGQSGDWLCSAPQPLEAGGWHGHGSVAMWKGAGIKCHAHEDEGMPPSHTRRGYPPNSSTFDLRTNHRSGNLKKSTALPDRLDGRK